MYSPAARRSGDPSGPAQPARAPRAAACSRAWPRPLTTPQVALALCEESGGQPGVVRCELVQDDGPLMSAVDAVAFALEHGLAIVSAQDVALLAFRAA